MELDPSVIALAPLEYRLEPKLDSTHAWYIRSRYKDKQFAKLRTEISGFFSECCSEIEPLPDRFQKKEFLELLDEMTAWVIHNDTKLRSILSRIGINYPQHPLRSEKAYHFVQALKAFSTLYGRRGSSMSKKYFMGALKSDLPYTVFSSFVLGTYTASYFHEYRARATEQHFRHHQLFVRARSQLSSRKYAVEDYLGMMKPIIQAYRDLTKSKCKLWWLIVLWNSKDLKEFTQGPQFLSIRKVDSKSFERVEKEYKDNLRRLRALLYELDPNIFVPTAGRPDRATKTMWDDMLWLRLGS